MTQQHVRVDFEPVGRSPGFSLIELMVVLAILSIVVAFAVPAYGDYVQRAKIGSAVAELREAIQRMDQRYADNRSFDNGNGQCAIPNYVDTENDFNFTCVLLNGGQGFRFRAIGQGSMAGFRYQVDDSGVETTLAVPAGWGSVAAPVDRFLLRKE